MASFADDMMRLIYFGDSISGIADNTATNPVNNFYVALHTANPADGDGNQSTYEATFIGYQREIMSRSNVSWDITSGSVAIKTDIVFNQALDEANESVEYFSIGMDEFNPSKILHAGSLGRSVPMHAGVSVTINAGGTIALLYW